MEAYLQYLIHLCFYVIIVGLHYFYAINIILEPTFLQEVPYLSLLVSPAVSIWPYLLPMLILQYIQYDMTYAQTDNSHNLVSHINMPYLKLAPICASTLDNKFY